MMEHANAYNAMQNSPTFGVFHILSNFLAYLQTFKLFAYFLHLVSSFCGVGGTNLAISTQGGGPPNFIEAQVPCQADCF